MDKDATIVFLDRFAVRVAGVVDPTRFVPADLGVDDVGAIVDPKKKCVRTVHIGRNTFPRDAATRVFNDAPAFSDGSGRENAPTVNSRLTHLNERHGEEARCASVNGYLLSIIESKELARVSSSYGEAGRKEEKLILLRQAASAKATASRGRRREAPEGSRLRARLVSLISDGESKKEEHATTGLPRVGGNAGPSRTCISWRERGNASDQLRRKKKQSVNRAALLQVRAERGSAEPNRSLMFHAMQSARNRLQNAV